MLRYLVPAMAFSFVVSACKDRSYNSEAASTTSPATKDMVTIHVEATNVGQPLKFASVTDAGECRGGNPKYYVPNQRDNPDWQPGKSLPDLMVDLSIKRVCLIGQAGGGAGGAQDSAYWDLPAGLKGGEKLVINGDQIFVADAGGGQGGTANADLTCDWYGAKLVVAKAGGTYVATITGAAAELIRNEQGKDVTATLGGYDDGKTKKTTKILPKQYISTNFDKPAEAPKVTISGLRKSDSGYGDGQYSPQISKEANGYKLVITYFEMTGSHSTMWYKYAEWDFGSAGCK